MPGLEKISQTAPDSVILLRILCFCDPENIPISIFKQGCAVLSQEDGRDLPTASAINELEAVIGLFRSSIRLSKAIQEIQRLSLAIYTSKQSKRMIRMHELVQLLLRSKLIAVDEREQWLEIAICIVCKAFAKIEDLGSPKNWSRCGQFVSHIEYMEVVAEKYGLRSTILLDACMWAATYFYECGLYQKAASMLKRTWERRKVVLGSEHPLTMVSMSSLAMTYQSQGRFTEAEELSVIAVKTLKTVLGQERLATLRSMNSLATTYSGQGRWKEAEELHVTVMKTMKRVLGEEHQDTLNSMNNVAATYGKQGRRKEAEKLHLAVMKTRKRVLGEEHPDALNSMNNLATTYSEQGRFKEAEELQVTVMQTTKRVLGEEHPDTLMAMHNLANTLQAQDQNAKAIDLMGECVNLRTRILGADHPYTLRSSRSLGKWQVQYLSLVVPQWII